MTNEQCGGGTGRIPVAKCPDCGYVFGEDLEFKFPEPSVCSCGAETENTTVADADTVQSLAAGIDQKSGDE